METKHYNIELENYNKEKQSYQNFCAAYKILVESDYNDRVKVMKERWGEITEDSTFYYGTSSYIKINLGADKKYHFELYFDNYDLDKYDINLPELPELSEQVTSEDLKKSLKGLAGKVISEQDNKKVIAGTEADINYLNIYNNITCSLKSKKEE